MSESLTILVVENGQNNQSVFTEATFPMSPRGEMILTEQISAKNFRLRQSERGYISDWHVAGDPTLISIQQGSLKIRLHTGEEKVFSAGEMFIARDYLPVGTIFDDRLHGHQAEVVGESKLQAIHIKLVE